MKFGSRTLLVVPLVIGLLLTGPSAALADSATLTQDLDTAVAGRDVVTVTGHFAQSDGSPVPDGTLAHFSVTPPAGHPDAISVGAPFVGLVPYGMGAGAGYWMADMGGGVLNVGAAPDLTNTNPHEVSGFVVGINTGDAGYRLVTDLGEVVGYNAPNYGDLSGVNLNASIVSMASTPNGDGYWLLSDDGGVFSFGSAPFHGSTGAVDVPATAIVTTPSGGGYWILLANGEVHSFGDAVFSGDSPDTGDAYVVGMAPSAAGGYWLVDSLGRVYPFGGAPYLGGAAGLTPGPVMSITATPDGLGYWLTDFDGRVFAFGDAQLLGSVFDVPTVDGQASFSFSSDAAGDTTVRASTAGSQAIITQHWLGAAGYRFVARDGGVFSFGDAPFHGSSAGWSNQPIVGMAATPTGDGYWFVADDGHIYAYGDAQSHGSPTGLRQPVVGMAATPTGDGYWLVARDGGIFSYGDAGFHGSAGGIHLNQPIVGMAATPSGEGYWFVAADGGIFSYGDASFHGSMGSTKLNQPIVGMAATPSGEGYWLVAADGGIFAFGDAVFYGSTGSMRLNQPIVGMAATPTGEGYWFVAADGGIFAFGDAPFFGSTGSIHLNQPIVGMAAA